MLPRIACARQPPVPGTRAVCRAVLTSFHLSDTAYGLNQLRYDLRKLKGHGLLQRDGSRYAYRLTPKRGPDRTPPPLRLTPPSRLFDSSCL